MRSMVIMVVVMLVCNDGVGVVSERRRDVYGTMYGWRMLDCAAATLATLATLLRHFVDRDSST